MAIGDPRARTRPCASTTISCANRNTTPISCSMIRIAMSAGGRSSAFLITPGSCAGAPAARSSSSTSRGPGRRGESDGVLEHLLFGVGQPKPPPIGGGCNLHFLELMLRLLAAATPLPAEPEKPPGMPVALGDGDRNVVARCGVGQQLAYLVR